MLLLPACVSHTTRLPSASPRNTVLPTLAMAVATSSMLAIMPLVGRRGRVSVTRRPRTLSTPTRASARLKASSSSGRDSRPSGSAAGWVGGRRHGWFQGFRVQQRCGCPSNALHAWYGSEGTRTGALAVRWVLMHPMTRVWDNGRAGQPPHCGCAHLAPSPTSCLRSAATAAACLLCCPCHWAAPARWPAAWSCATPSPPAAQPAAQPAP
jgi:hypothetical protein